MLSLVLLLVKWMAMGFYATSYSPELGLLESSPNVEQGIYYVSESRMAGLTALQYDTRGTAKWGVLIGEAMPEETFTYISEIIDLGGGVKSEVDTPDGPRFLDWLEYGDRVLLAAINARNAGDQVREVYLMSIARSMWDGMCIRGKVFRVHLEQHGYGVCETYKTAFYYYMTGDPAALLQLLRMQEHDPGSNNFGGFVTHYFDSGEPLPWSDANIETTAVALFALGAARE